MYVRGCVGVWVWVGICNMNKLIINNLLLIKFHVIGSCHTCWHMSFLPSIIFWQTSCFWKWRRYIRLYIVVQCQALAYLLAVGGASSFWRSVISLLGKTCTHTDIPTYLPTYLHTYIHTYILYIHTYIHTYIHIYIYIDTYIYIHTHHTQPGLHNTHVCMYAGEQICDHFAWPNHSAEVRIKRQWLMDPRWYDNQQAAQGPTCAKAISSAKQFSENSLFNSPWVGLGFTVQINGSVVIAMAPTTHVCSLYTHCCTEQLEL